MIRQGAGGTLIAVAVQRIALRPMMSWCIGCPPARLFRGKIEDSFGAGALSTWTRRLATASCLAFDSSNDAIDLKTPAKPTANQMIVDTTRSSGKPAVLAAAWARAMCLQTAFLNEALLDRRDVRLGIAKRVRRRVDRVVPQDEIVLVRSGRAENELGIGQRHEFHRFARRLESREVPVP